MKNINVLVTMLFCLLFLAGCHNQPKRSKQKSVELMSAQSLGLGYLEEFKLNEAEKEFLKYIKLAPNEKLGYANLGLTYLRMGRYEDAKKQLYKAIEIAPKDPDIRLILATAYQMNDERKRAISELNETLAFAPDHIKVLYFLSELYAAESDKESQKLREECVLKLSKIDPGNIVHKLNLTDIYIRNEEADKALEQLEIIRKQFPEFPKEAEEYYNKTLLLLRKGNTKDAIVPFTIFHNYIKVTSPYQAGIMDLKGPGGSLVGFPLISFAQPSTSMISENKSLLDVIKFTNVTESAGLSVVPSWNEGENSEFRNSTHVEEADYDNDGDGDLYVGCYDPATSSYRHWLFNNEMGRYKDVSEKVGINHEGKEKSAAFADYDNDGYLDLYVLRDKGNILYRNAGEGNFENVTDDAKLNNISGGTFALFFDCDHDGDLDLFETREGSNLLFRNNGDGTFQQQAEKMGLSSGNPNPPAGGWDSREAAFGDFEDDGVIDLFVVNGDTSNILYSNQRGGIFKNVTEKSGLTSTGGSTSVTVGDYNNDGFLDLFVTSEKKGEQVLYRNQGNANFEPAGNPKEMFSAIQMIKVNDARFFDFDNDGHLDLIIAGEPKEKGGRALFLYHNDGKGNFTDVSGLLPEEPKSGRQIAIFDYNEDGDPDIVIAGINGGVFTLKKRRRELKSLYQDEAGWFKGRQCKEQSFWYWGKSGNTSR